MEKTVKVSYQEYQSLVDKVQEQAQMLNELHKGSVLIKRGLPEVAFSDCGLIELRPHFFVTTKDDAVRMLADELAIARAESIKSYEDKIKNKENALNLAQDQIQEMLSDMMKIPAFVRRLFGVK